MGNKVLFNTYPIAFACPGGGEIQLLKSKMALEKMGTKVLLYDAWSPQFEQVDIVHFFSVQGGSSQFCDYVRTKGLPLAISPIIWLTEETKKEMPIVEIGHLLRTCNLILPNSELEARQLSDFYDLSREKFFVVYNGIDDSFGKSVSGDLFRKHFDIQGPFLLNVANIEPRKNQLSLIRAVSDMNIDLIILGNIRSEPYFDKCVKEGRKFLKYLGYINHEDDLLKSAYDACEAFVLPSMLETPGLAALEAAASGARIIITSEGSTREYFGDLVAYVNPREVDDINGGIRRVLNRPREDRLRKHVTATFTWSRTAEQLQNAYQHCLRPVSKKS